MLGWLAKVKAAFTRIVTFRRTPASDAAHKKTFDQKIVARFTARKIPNWSQLRQWPHVASRRETYRILIVLLIFLISLVTLLTRSYYRATLARPAPGGIYT